MYIYFLSVQYMYDVDTNGLGFWLINSFVISCVEPSGSARSDLVTSFWTAHNVFQFWDQTHSKYDNLNRKTQCSFAQIKFEEYCYHQAEDLRSRISPILCECGTRSLTLKEGLRLRVFEQKIAYIFSIKLSRITRREYMWQEYGRRQMHTTSLGNLEERHHSGDLAVGYWSVL